MIKNNKIKRSISIKHAMAMKSFGNVTLIALISFTRKRFWKIMNSYRSVNGVSGFYDGIFLALSFMTDFWLCKDLLVHRERKREHELCPKCSHSASSQLEYFTQSDVRWLISTITAIWIIFLWTLPHLSTFSAFHIYTFAWLVVFVHVLLTWWQNWWRN